MSNGLSPCESKSGGKILQTTYHGVPRRFLLGELNAEAKVCDLDLPPSIDENIVRLDVSVYAPKAVQEGHGLQT